MHSREEVVSVQGLHKSFGRHAVLKGINLTAQRGEVVALIGGSGSGKSTTLRCLNLLNTPTSVSRFRLLNQDLTFRETRGVITGVESKRQLRALRSRVAMVFQNFNLWPHMTLVQNVIEAQVQVLNRTKAEARDKAESLLARVGLSDRSAMYPHQLSGGQQQRGAIARALAMDPEVMLFDEPTSVLDPELEGEVLTVMQSLAEEGRTMFIVTHEMRFAATVSHRVLFLREGRVEEEGLPNQIFGAPQSENLKRFIGTHI
ncbi:ATP-binding cassette domain-containing protein [Arenibacterium sp. LLYu02]|uniref:ATP-binding cassette domain-containing protein n=1 Tax=Arenibacterium sp. LLYu02 TaxID=3404132 RepID=UPI003B20CA04